MEMDYRDFIDIAKLNLSNELSEKLQLYKKTQNTELKNKIIELMTDKKQILLFNKEIIKKYI